MKKIQHNYKLSQAGFSMLEVLVSLILVALTMLGQAGLQASALKLSKGAASRMQAVMLTDEIAERIENNKVGDYSLSSATTASAASTNCMTSNCSSSQLASYDLAAWTTRATTSLVNPAWSITKSGTNPATYTIFLSWQDRRDNAKATTYTTTGTSETFSITSTKVVYQ